MEVFFLLFAGLALGAIGAGGSGDTSDTSEDAADLSAETDSEGNLLVQASDDSTEINGADIIDFIANEEGLSSLPEGSVGLHAGDGDDTISIGDLATPFVYGGSGDDIISSETVQGIGPQVVNGNEGNDTIDARGADVFGDIGDDVITGGGDANFGTFATLDGGAGHDTITADYNTTVIGGAGDDMIFSNDYSVVHGGDGSDTITAHGFATRVDGGEGDDTLIFEGEGQEIAPDGNAQYFNSSLTGGEGADTFIISEQFTAMPNTSGNTSSSLFCTVTDFNAAEDSLEIDLGIEDDAVPVGAVLDLTYLGATESAGIGAVDLNFEFSQTDTDGATTTETMTIRLIEYASDIDLSQLSISQTDTGFALSL